MRVRAYAGEQWWVLALAVAVAVVCVVVAYALVARRDLGAGLLAPRRGPAEAPRQPRCGPFALAWRLQRGILLGWLVGLALGGAVMGGAANGIAGAFTDNQQLVRHADPAGRQQGPARRVPGARCSASSA